MNNDYKLGCTFKKMDSFYSKKLKLKLISNFRKWHNFT